MLRRLSDRLSIFVLPVMVLAGAAGLEAMQQNPVRDIRDHIADELHGEMIADSIAVLRVSTQWDDEVILSTEDGSTYRITVELRSR